MSKSANKMSVLQLTILTADHPHCGEYDGFRHHHAAVEAGTGGRTLYHFLACHGWTLYGFASHRFDLKKAKSDNEAAAKGTA